MKILFFLFSLSSAAFAQDLKLTPEQNVTITTQSGDMKLADVFTTKYILVDFSQSGCGYCIDLSRGINHDASKQAMFSGEKCKLVTVVPRGDLSRWVSVINHGFVGDNSYEVKSLSGMAKAFKFSLRGTPSTLLIDRMGMVVSSAVGSEPSDLDTFCH